MARDHLSIVENTTARDMRGMTVLLPNQQVINSAAQRRRRHRGPNDLENRGWSVTGPRLVRGYSSLLGLHRT